MCAIDTNQLQGRDPKFYFVAGGYIEQKISGAYYWANKYISVTADGKFSTYLPDGTYRIYIYHLNNMNIFYLIIYYLIIIQKQSCSAKQSDLTTTV